MKLWKYNPVARRALENLADEVCGSLLGIGRAKNEDDLVRRALWYKQTEIEAVAAFYKMHPNTATSLFTVHCRRCWEENT